MTRLQDTTTAYIIIQPYFAQLTLLKANAMRSIKLEPIRYSSQSLLLHITSFDLVISRQIKSLRLQNKIIRKRSKVRSKVRVGVRE